ncbi:PLD nuclease N-terminal domain-containing protein, partial [Luteococcus sp. H138]|uniref:PLD nuclease N-terminal domain-containing protein n=2 Tax=unclassified Luteococcus TaxID=2639923 RepID=UPI00313C0619
RTDPQHHQPGRPLQHQEKNLMYQPLHISLETAQPQHIWVAVATMAALLVAFWLAAVVSIVGSPISGGEKLLFILATLGFPFLGPLVWFVFIAGKHRH